jgi:predicted unusual protein kinase regulating ubiquinone biosynthesis (AarF/ABC1/UbiB family)
MARAGVGTAASMVSGSGKGLERAVDRLGELRGLGTKVGQMAGLLEANLSPEVQKQVGPALAKLRAQAARSPYEAVAALIEEDLGAPPGEVFARFDPEPFASASLGQVHDAEDHEGRHLAVKVQHPGIREAFEHDLQNVGQLGRLATTFFMPSGQSGEFLGGIKDGFLAELDYEREADNMATFAALIEGDDDLEIPEVVHDVSSPRVLSTTFLEGVTVEYAHDFDEGTRRRQAAAVRRLVLSALTDHGVLYADAHAGNFFFREDGTVGVLDFGSIFRFGDEQRDAFAALRDAAAASDRAAFGLAVDRALGIGNHEVAEAFADVQWIAIGGLVRGEAIGSGRVREITSAAAEMKKRILMERFSLPFFMPFLMRTMVACNALLAALDAPESGELGSLPGARRTLERAPLTPTRVR